MYQPLSSSGVIEDLTEIGRAGVQAEEQVGAHVVDSDAGRLLLSATNGTRDVEDVGEALDGLEEATEMIYVFYFRGHLESRGAVAVGLGFDGGDEGLLLAEDRADVGEEASAISRFDDQVDAVDL